MKTKLIQTNDYLLLIDEEAEIKENNIVINQVDYEEDIIFKADKGFFNTGLEADLVIAYYPLTKEAEELDLPLLPNPFEKEVYVEELADKFVLDYGQQENIKEDGLLATGFVYGYKAAQSKQFSLEDMKKAFEEGGKRRYICEANGKDKKCYCRNDDECNFASYITPEEYIQSLSTQQLPKEFIPKKGFDYGGDGALTYVKTLNSEGKEELVGTWKY